MPAIKPTPSRRSGQEVGAYFCQPAVTPAIDRIDQPSVIDLRQATVLRMLEKTPERYSCEAVIRAQPGLVRRVYVQMRADFYRERYGRSGVTIGTLNSLALTKTLAGTEPALLPEFLEVAFADRIELLGRSVMRDVLQTMLEAQRARRRGAISSRLRQRIYRLREKTGLPLQVELL